MSKAKLYDYDALNEEGLPILPKQNKHHNLNKFDFIDGQFNFKKINLKIKSWAHSSKIVVTSDICLCDISK